MQTEHDTLSVTRENLTHTILMLVVLPILGLCISSYTSHAVWLHTLTPGIEVFVPIPEGYKSSRTFRAARRHDFPALHGDPPPAPLADTGHLLDIESGKPYGVEAAGTDQWRDVTTLRIGQAFGPHLVAHLDVPLDPDLQEHLLNLDKGTLVTVAGIGHGNGQRNIYIYPVHQVNGYTP